MAARNWSVAYAAPMREARIDEAVLALLYLGIHERHATGGARTWKSFDCPRDWRVIGAGRAGNAAQASTAFRPQEFIND